MTETSAEFRTPDVDPAFAEASYLPNCHYVVIDPVGEFGSWRVVKWGKYPLD